MKAITLSLAAISGAGFLFHNQLQSLVHQASRGTPGAVQLHQAPEGVYYLRTAYTFPVPGRMMRWSAGQELRAATNASAANGMVALTDGQNTAAVPETAVTQDMDAAAILRQQAASMQQPQAVPQSGSDNLTASATRTATSAPFVSSSSYYNNTVIVERPTQVVVPRREVIVREHHPQPRNTPAPVMRTY